MSRPIQLDRAAHLLMSGDPDLDYDDARSRLDRAAIVISSDQAVHTAWGQAALLTIAECGVRMFHGGVYLRGDFDVPVKVGLSRPISLKRRLVGVGCRTESAPEHAVGLHVGAEAAAKAFLRCWADGWVATVSPQSPASPIRSGNELSGALAGALGTSEAFRHSVLGDVRAGKRTQRLSPITPVSPDPNFLELRRLPIRCWLLGLGNLGQALLWVLGLLPYADPEDVELLLQDPDISAPENLDTQILTKFGWIGRKKARAAAEWAEAQGFRTVVSERLFSATTRRQPAEPGLVFVGVDNIATRRLVASADAGFNLVIDAGLGATGREVFDIRIHSFPGARKPKQAWPGGQETPEEELTPALARLVAQGRLDRCGAIEIAGKSVGMPSTAVVAATIQIAQACRALATGTYCDLVDTSLKDTRRTTINEAVLPRAGVLPFQKARNGN